MIWLVIVIGAIAAAAAVVWFLSNSKHPESSASHVDEASGLDHVGRGTGEAGVADRPGGPDAENMASDPPGGFTAPGSADTTHDSG